MKVSLNWISNYVKVLSDTQALCDLLDLTGTGVEGVDTSGAAFSGVVIGQVVSKVPHPNSDHMFITKVDVGPAHTNDAGEPEPLQIVCGAQNFYEGDKIPVAMIGAKLPGDITIKKSKLRGEVSMGMNCSARELGLGEDVDGLYILPEDAPLGEDFGTYMKLTDTVLDLEITPNRPDCLSIEGMAREFGAVLHEDVKDVCADFDLTEDTSLPQTKELVSVEITDESRSPRYAARVITDVKIGPSPDWLAQRVAASGARSINNVVDATNYILFLLGQPLHAFDYDRLTGREAGSTLATNNPARIIVRPAHEGEKLTTLDDVERELTPDMTLISTPERAVALAGVMGGQETEVTDATTTVLLECATFNPAHTSRTSRNLGLISESSMRYERGVDAARIARNLDVAAALIADIAGGRVAPGVVDVYPVHAQTHSLTYRHDRFCRMMGAEVPLEDAKEILTRLGCGLLAEEGTTLTVEVPTYRPDLEREIDLYEEVIRIWGMERVPDSLPQGAGRVAVVSPREHALAKLHMTLRACGMNETMTYSFADAEDIARARLTHMVLGEPVELINPINAEQSVMRQSILPNLLHSISYNQHQGVPFVSLYEQGSVFSAYEGKKLPNERTMVVGVMHGATAMSTWSEKPHVVDFFDGKGALEAIAHEFALKKVRFKVFDPEVATHLQPGRAAQMLANGAVIGWVGEIHPLVLKEFDITGIVVAFELDFEALMKASRFARDFIEIPHNPAVMLDVAFVVDEDVTHERLMQCMSSAGGKFLEHAELFDVYRDEKRVGAGKKSMAYKLTYRAADRTLTSEEVQAAHDKLIMKVSKATGAEVRG